MILIWQVCQSKVFFIQSHFLLIKAKLFGRILHSFCHFTHNSWAWLCEQKWAIFQHCPQKCQWWLWPVWPWHEQTGYLIKLTPVITVANDPPMAGHMSIPRLWISRPPVRTLQPATSADITLCYCGVLMMQGTPGLCKTSSLPRRGTPTDRTAEIRIWSCHACRRITSRCHDLWQSDTGGRSCVTWYGEKFISPRQTIFFHFALSKLTCHDFASYFAYICLSLPILN